MVVHMGVHLVVVLMEDLLIVHLVVVVVVMVEVPRTDHRCMVVHLEDPDLGAVRTVHRCTDEEDLEVVRMVHHMVHLEWTKDQVTKSHLSRKEVG